MPASPNRPTNRVPGPTSIPGEHASEHNEVAKLVNQMFKRPIGTTRTAAFTVQQSDQAEVIPVQVTTAVTVTVTALDPGTEVDLVQTAAAGFTLNASGVTFVPGGALTVAGQGRQVRLTWVTPNTVFVSGDVTTNTVVEPPLLTDGFTGTDNTAWSTANWATGLTPTLGGGAVIIGNAGRLQAGRNGSYSNNDRISRRVNLPDRTDFEAKFRVKFDTTEHYLRFAYRANRPDLYNETQFAVMMSTAFTDVRLVRTLAFADSSLGSIPITVASNGTWYWVRVRVVGTSHRVKVWTDGSSEPAVWGIDIANAATTAGAIGFAGNSGAAAVVTNAFIDDFTLVDPATGSVSPANPVLDTV